MKKHATLLVAGLLLSACTSMSLKTIYKLATTDPMQVDPVLLRAAVRMPEWISPRPDGVKLNLSSTQEGEAPLTETFILEPISLATESGALQEENKAGYHLSAYRIASADIPRFRQFRDDAKARKVKSSKKSGGTISLSADACRKGTLPDSKIQISTYLRFETNMDYFPVVVDYDLRQAVKKDNLATLIPPCTAK